MKGIDPEKAITKGAKLLDKKVSGWAKKIKVTKLKLETDEQCILGQLYDDPCDGLVQLGLVKIEDIPGIKARVDELPDPKVEKVILSHGFMVDLPEQVKIYNRLWKEAVKQRKTNH